MKGHTDVPPITPTFGLVDDLSVIPDRTPLEFKIVGYNADRQPTTFVFHARPTMPLGAMLDVASAANEEGGVNVSAITSFLSAVITTEDADAWSAALHDPELYFVDTMLQGLVEWLAATYAERPTPPPSASQPGGGSTGTSPTVAPASVVSTSAVSQ